MSYIPADVQEFGTFLANISVAIALFALVYQIRRERRQNEFDAYVELYGDFAEISLKLIEMTGISEVVYKGKNKPTKWDKYTELERQAYSYFDLLLGLFERVWIGKEEVKIPEREWLPWQNWIEDLASIELFAETFQENRKQFDNAFATKMD